MIVDFRVRPPYGGYLDTNIYRESHRTVAMVKDQGYAPSPSLLKADFDACLREQAAAGIDVAVVPGRYTTPSYGRVANEDLAKLMRAHCGKIVCFAAVDTASARAADQLEAAVKDLGLAGLTLDPGFYDPPRYADDPLFEPLYRRCVQLDVPVAVTYSGHAGPDIGYADPVRIDRVAAALPDLKLIVVHAAWPWVPQILGSAFRRPNLYLSPDMYMVNMPGASDFVEAANGFLRDRVFFGSSYPFLPFDEAVRYYRHLPFKDEVMAGVMGDNAARLLKLG